jgi:hypothetical protein
MNVLMEAGYCNLYLYKQQKERSDPNFYFLDSDIIKYWLAVVDIL